MAESKVKRETHIVLHGWMLTDLKLKGNELIIYACIYGFSQAEDQAFYGGLQYLADWTNSTKSGVIKCLKSLVEKNYISKVEKVINGVKFCEYRATKLHGVYNKVAWGMQQSCMGGIQQSLPNNININNIEDSIEDKKKERKASTKTTYDTIISDYTDNDSLKETLVEFIKMRQRIRKPMTDKALALLLKNLDKLASDDPTKIKILEQSIMNSWQGVFELKNNNNYGKRGNQDDGYAGYYKPDTSGWQNSPVFNDILDEIFPD